MFRRILRAYDLAPTQVSPNGWSQMVGGMYLWFRHSFGAEMPLHVFQTIYQPRKLPRKKGGEEEVGWYYFCPWGSHKPLVTGCPSSIKQWKESWFWVSGNWQRVFDDPEPDLDAPSVYEIASPLPRCELPGDVVDVLKSIYQADQKTRSYGFILNRHRCLVELGLMASKAEMDQGLTPRVLFNHLDTMSNVNTVDLRRHVLFRGFGGHYGGSVRRYLRDYNCAIPPCQAVPSIIP
ncbi:Plus3 domain-containing protein [Abeliophyllum distichum]|uniref:Plus3 domain-containing protein n=1 Tax=Abeliophyllum distichum TaxID=126358 RepID=A0ABD1Q1P0_9LAMI